MAAFKSELAAIPALLPRQSRATIPGGQQRRIAPATWPSSDERRCGHSTQGPRELDAQKKPEEERRIAEGRQRTADV